MIPIIETIQTSVKIVQPKTGFAGTNAQIVSGVYDPAINRKTEQWSKICITFLPLMRGDKP